MLLQFLFLMVHELSFMLWTIQNKTTHLKSVQHIVGKHKQTLVQRQAMLSWQTRNQRSHDVLDFTEHRIKAFRQHAGELIYTHLELSLQKSNMCMKQQTAPDVDGVQLYKPVCLLGEVSSLND